MQKLPRKFYAEYQLLQSRANTKISIHLFNHSHCVITSANMLLACYLLLYPAQNKIYYSVPYFNKATTLLVVRHRVNIYVVVRNLGLYLNLRLP